MISAFKRLVKTDTSTSAATPTLNPTTPSDAASAAANGSGKSPIHANLFNSGVQMISQSLQKKFSKGVNYNMKIVIKGDYNVGKSSLWLRLQGQPFKEQYESSEEIKVANIQWSYKLTDDVVKVEVWDVVDRSKKKRAQQQPTTSDAASSSSLKLDNSEVSAATAAKLEPSLDAEFIDVYKNANGCILVYDMTKPWTWDYVERELPKIPAHIPVLVVGNHRDMHHHRTVDELKCKFFIESLNRGSLGSAVRYTETSMRSGFGLNYLHKFFSIPFLQLRRENLMQQLEINAKEMDNICEELQHMEEGIEDEYGSFSDKLNTQRRQQQEDNAKDVLKNAKSVDEARRVAAEREAAAVAAQRAAEANMAEPKKMLNQLITKVIPAQSQPASVSMSVTIDPASKAAAGKLNPSMSLNDMNKKQQQQQQIATSKSPNNFQLSLAQDDEFNRFLDDPVKGSSQANTPAPLPDEEDDNDDNPMVAAFKETLDSSDEDLSAINKKLASIPTNLDNDDDQQENEVKPTNGHIETVPSNQLLTFASQPTSVDVSESTMKPSDGGQLQLNNDDFAFLESLSSNLKPPASNVDENGNIQGGNEDDDDADQSIKKSSKSEKKKKNASKEKKSENGKKKKSGNNGKSSETESVDSKASQSKKKDKTTKKSAKSNSSKKTANSFYDENEEDAHESSSVAIKKDVDYEEL